MCRLSLQMSSWGLFFNLFTNATPPTPRNIPMRKNSCLFNKCKLGLLDKDPEQLSRQEQQHVRRYHRHATHAVGLNGALFIFRRDPSRHNQYVCVCDRLLSTTESLTQHVQGSQRPSNTQDPCSLISARAAEIAQTREVVEDEEKPINYRPVDRKHAVPESDEIIDEEIMDEVIIDDDLSSNDIEVLDGNNDEDENNLKSMLKAEDRALKVAINTLKKARADIKKRLAQ